MADPGSRSESSRLDSVGVIAAALSAVLFLAVAVTTVVQTTISRQSSQHVVAEVVECQAHGRRSGGTCDVVYIDAAGARTEGVLDRDRPSFVDEGDELDVWVRSDGTIVTGSWRAWVRPGIFAFFAFLIVGASIAGIRRSRRTAPPP